MCQPIDDPGLFERSPQFLPGRVVELGIDVGDHQRDLAHAALLGQAHQLVVGGVRRLRQHRRADQPVGRRLAEFQQPVVVDAVAGDAQRRVVGRDLEDRAEDHLALHAVAVHVGEAQLGDRRAARALVVNAGAVKRIVERLYRPAVAGRRRLAVPAAPHLAVANPHRLPVALLDMWSAVAQFGGQPRRPQIGRQLATDPCGRRRRSAYWPFRTPQSALHRRPASFEASLREAPQDEGAFLIIILPPLVAVARPRSSDRRAAASSSASHPRRYRRGRSRRIH